MATLSTLSALKIHLGISSSAQDTLLGQILNSVDAACLKFLNRGEFISTTRTEYLDGGGRQLLPLRYRPLTAVTGVWVDAKGYYGNGASAFPASSEYTLGENYTPVSGFAENEKNSAMLLAIGGVWPDSFGNVKVTYTAGYTVVPADIQLAVNTLCAVVFKSRKEGLPLASETFGEYSYELLKGGDLAVSGIDLIGPRATLTRYREVAI